MDRYARTPRAKIVPRVERTPTAAPGPAERVLALQRGAGNRAVASILARRVIGNDSGTRVVHLTVGVELTTKLAQRAWELTTKGPLDEAGVETLRQIALEHWFGTIDDDERLFIAALLDPDNAAKLHATYPRGFSDDGSVIEFDAASITASNRRIVQDSGRSKRPAPDAAHKASTKDQLDQDILAMGHPNFEYTVRQVLKFADQAHVDHVALYFAMLNGASDSTAGDRAFAGAAFVVARREGMAVDRDILAGRLKIDEVSTTFFDAMGDRAQAVYSPEADGQLKGDTLYLPATFDMDNLADLGVLVHELQHASDDAAVDRPTSRSRLEVESAAYERQSRFLMLELEKLSGDARTKAEADVGSRIGQTHVYFMIATALEATGDDQFDDRARIVAGVNRNKDPGTELEPAELRRALDDTKEGNRAKARAGIVDDIKRHKRPRDVVFRGFKGESALDVTPAPARTLQRSGQSVSDVKRTLARRPRKLQRDKKKGIHVHQGSKLSSAQFVNALTGNQKVPRWLAKRLASANGSLVLSGKIAAPEDRIWLFVDAFADAINSGAWEITTAKSTIEVKEDADKKRAWTQLVVPDLQKGEHLGTWGKTGPGQEDLLRTSLFSDLPEVIYGWTSPDQATELTHEKRGFIVIVTEIEVTAPNGKKRTFKPSADNMAEAILHEISVHAGRITEGRADVHDDRDTAVKDVVNEVGEFFKATVAGSDELERSPLSKEILRFVGERP